MNKENYSKKHLKKVIKYGKNEDDKATKPV